jgi:hypothetical protein
MHRLFCFTTRVARALTQTSPLSKLLAVWHLDQWDLVLRAQSDHELLVRLLLACLVQHAHMRLSPVERLAGFPQAACETIVDQGELENSLEGVENGHLALARGVGRHLDFGGGGGASWLFSVRLKLVVSRDGNITNIKQPPRSERKRLWIALGRVWSEILYEDLP